MFHFLFFFLHHDYIGKLSWVVNRLDKFCLKESVDISLQWLGLLVSQFAKSLLPRADRGVGAQTMLDYVVVDTLEVK
jgi:hypothetical protein